MLATETGLSPVSVAAIKRKLNRKVKFVISYLGQVTVGLRKHYARHRQPDPLQTLQYAVETERLKPENLNKAWSYFVARQIMLGEVLRTLGRIDPSAFSAILLQQEASRTALGTFLVAQEIISEETLQHALVLQAQIQPTIEEVIQKFGTSR